MKPFTRTIVLRALIALAIGGVLTLQPGWQPAQGQRAPATSPGHAPVAVEGRFVALRAEHVDARTRITRPAPVAADEARDRRGPRATFSVTYTGFPPQAQAAFQAAVDIWQDLTTSPVPITVDAVWTPIDDPGVLGQAKADRLYAGFPAAPLPDVAYPSALANKLCGCDLDAGRPDIVATFNSSFTRWYLGTDGNPPPGTFDLETVALHELGHGLGFFGSMTVQHGIGGWGADSFSFIFDQFAADVGGRPLLDTTRFPNPSAALAAQLTGGAVFFDGGNARRAAGRRSRPKLWAPATWVEGTSFSHLDELAYPPGDRDSLMTPSLRAAEAIHDPGPITLGIFADLGWNLPSPEPPPVERGAWSSIGPDGGSIRTLAIDPVSTTNVYAGTDGGGIFQTADGGVTWSAVNTGLTNSFVTTVAVDPLTATTLYAGVRDPGAGVIPTNQSLVFKSTNGGGTWSLASNGLAPSRGVTSLAIDPQDPRTLYVSVQRSSPPTNAVPPAAAYKSVDGGATWSELVALRDLVDPPGPFRSGGFISSLAIDPHNPGTVYAAGAGRGGPVYKSTDGGATWASVFVDGGFIANALVLDPAASANVYVGASGVLYKSNDGGGSWTSIRGGLADGPIASLLVDPSSPSTLYAGITGNGAYKSNDGGGSWTSIRGGLTNLSVQALAIDPRTPSAVYAGTASNAQGVGAVFKTTTAGSRWSRTSRGLVATAINAIAVEPTNDDVLYAGTANDGVLKSINGGATWSSINAGLDGLAISTLAVDPNSPGTLFVGVDGPTDTAAATRFYKSTNGGGQWRPANAGLPPNGRVLFITFAPGASGVLYIGGQFGSGERGLFKSVDAGATWTAFGVISDSAATPVGAVGSLVIDPVTPNTWYAAMQGCPGFLVYKSTDAGVTWAQSSSGLPCGFSSEWSFRCQSQGRCPAARDLAIDPSNPRTLYVAMDVAGVYKSADGGASWRAASLGMPGERAIRVVVVDPRRPRTLYAGGTSGAPGLPGAVYQSTDGGASWTAFTDGLLGPAVGALELVRDPSAALYAGTLGNGLFVSRPTRRRPEP